MVKKKTLPATDSETKEHTVQDTYNVPGIDRSKHIELINHQISDSQSFWAGKGWKLKETREENESYYLGEYIDDDEEGEHPNDNRIFSSIRTIVPNVTTRITEPEVYPSSKTEAAKKFADDFERALFIKAEREKVKIKLRFALEDAIIQRGGYLKPRYDAATGNFCSIEYVPCESIIIDHKALMYEEPRYFRHVLDKTPEDLITMFPAMKTKIIEVFKLEHPEDYLNSKEVNEDWKFIVIDGKLDLVVSWSFGTTCFGLIKDPNWRYDDNNFLPRHMMPLIPINVLSNGRHWIDRTSYVEQAKRSQKTIDTRSKQIGDNAGLGSVGMPVVDSNAISEEQSEYLDFEPHTVISLDVPEGRSVNDVFTKWQASALPADVYKDKTDAIAAVQNAFPASSVQQGQQTENNTLGQDELLRDSSVGRQQEIVEAIDNAMDRLYPFIAQFLLVYGDETEMFEYTGENAEFDQIIMHTDSLDTNAVIRVKGGTSMPIDNPQRRATAKEAAAQGMIDPLTFWEIMDEPNSQKYAKRVVDYTNDPASFLKDVDEELFNRDAFTDIELIKRGQEPDFREDLDQEYFDYLNKFILSGNLESPNIAPEVAQAISAFIDIQLARGQKMLGMAETQLPTTDEVQQHNDQVAAQEAGMPPADPNAPGAPPAGPAAPAPKPGEPAKPLPTPVEER